MTTTKRSNFGAAIRTTLLLATLTGLFVVIGFAIGGAQTALLFLLLRRSVQLRRLLVQRQDRAEDERREAGPEEEAPRLYQMVRELTTRAGLPMPTLHVIPQEQPNAFATGRSPEHVRGRRHAGPPASCSPRTSCAACSPTSWRTSATATC